MSRKRIITPDPIDVQVGFNIKTLRAFQGLSQAGLADIVKVSHQQIQKYELGKNRIAASVLAKIARALETTEQRLFKDTHKELKIALPLFQDKDMRTLREFITIPDENTKEQLRGLISFCSKYEKGQNHGIS